MSPRGHATGSRAFSRQRLQNPKGRKESRLSCADFELQFDLACSLSYEVKTGRVVFLLPVNRELGG